MKYTFKDFNNPKLFSDNLRVLIVTGSYSIFNNMACDKVRAMCKGRDIEYDPELFAEFGIKLDDGANLQFSNNLSFDEFRESISVMPTTGKWYCSTPISMLTKKQKDWFKNYIKDPSDNGILVLFSTEFKEYLEYLKDKTVNNSPYVHIIQLSFPDKDTLYNIVAEKFKDNGIVINKPEIETFIFRMSNAYDDYDAVITNICLDFDEGHVLDKKELLERMKGINNCVLDDFIDKLLIPFKNDTPTNRKAVFRMLGALIEEYGAEDLCKRLKKQIDIYISFRQEINKGNIPVLIKYSLKEARRRLGEDHPLNKVSDYRFKRMAFIASRTSLRDWVYMRLLLDNTTYLNKRSYEEALYRVTVRSILNPCMLNYDINIDSIESVGMSEIDDVVYDESLLKKAKELEESAFENKVRQQELHMKLIEQENEQARIEQENEVEHDLKSAIQNI